MNLGPLIMVLAGLAVSLYSLTLLVRARRAAGWPVAPGIITKVEEQVRSTKYYGPNLRTAVTYSYRVGGEEWEGSRIRFDDGALTTSFWSWIRVYQVGDAVEVHYDPAIPSHAVIEIGMSAYACMMLLIGALLLIGGGVLMFGWRH